MIQMSHDKHSSFAESAKTAVELVSGVVPDDELQ